MSVIVPDRAESKSQFIATAQELVKFTTQKCLKLPKRLTFFITTDIVKSAQNVYKYAFKIKNLMGCGEERIILCKKCIGELEYLASMLDVLKIYAPIIKEDKDNEKNKNPKEKNFTEYTWTKWNELITQEIALINGIAKKEKHDAEVQKQK